MSSDRERFEHLATTCGPRVLAYLARRAEPPADAADIYQQVLVTTWRRLRSIPADDAGALAWMFGVARRSLANHRRGLSRRLAATERLRLTVTTAVSEPETDDALLVALGELSADDRELLTLVYWDGLSAEEAGRVLSITSATARKRLQRAREKLRDQLEADPPLQSAGRGSEVARARPSPVE